MLIWERYVVGLLEVVYLDLGGEILGTVIEALGRSSSFVDYL